MIKYISLKDLGVKLVVPMRDKPKKFEGTIPWCRIEDIDGKYIHGTKSNKYVSDEIISEMNLKVLPKNSIIYSCSATIGEVAINTTELCTNQTFIGIIPSKEVDVDYLYYALKLFGSSLKYMASQTTIPYISQDKFYDLKIPFFTKDTQSKIASILSILDRKIELNNNINQELEELSKTLFNYWFFQFEFPDENGKPFKSSGGQMVYNDILKREIPKGWIVENIQNIADIVDCLHSKKPDYINDGSGKYLLQLENILDNGLVDVSNKYFVKEADYLTWISRIEVQEHDILITNAGRVAATSQVSKEIISGIGRNITAIRPGKISPTYLFLSLRGFDLTKQIKSNTDQGAFFTSFNVKGIKLLNVLVPDANIEIEFEKLVYPWRRMRELNLKQNEELAALRDWLIPMLMNGQVTVGEAEDKIGEAIRMVTKPHVVHLEPLTFPLKDKRVRRKALATYIVNQSLNDSSFGKTKFEKLLHLIEYHILKTDYNQKYSIQAAGPYDGGFTKIYWDEVQKSQWFGINEYGTLKRIVPGANHSKSLKDYGYFSEEEKLKIRSFIKLFENDNYERPEIVSTLYAVWNNRIIRKELVTDELLKKDFLEWDAQKKKYTSRLDKALEWMRQKEIIPDGWGSVIERAKSVKNKAHR